MLKLAPLLKHLSQENHSPTLLQVAFHNYFSTLYAGEDVLTEESLQRFIDDALDYPHWQQNRALFTRDLIPELQKAADDFGSGLDLESIDWPLELQIIDIQSLKTWSDAISSHLLHHQPQQQYRLVHDAKLNRMLAITLKNSGELCVQVFDRRFVIRHGSLSPLRTDLMTHFGSDLELASGRPQKLDMGAHSLSRFIVDEKSYQGGATRGYLFQPVGEFATNHLEEVPRLFYALKRIEKFFTRRETDPFYQGLLRQLERAIKLGRLGDSVSLSHGSDILARSQDALEYVFDDDKLLGSLIREFQQIIAAHPQVGRSGTAAGAIQWQTPLHQFTENSTPTRTMTTAMKSTNLAKAKIQNPESDLIS